MGRIVVVRHGQASFGQADYDRLSELGVRQCEMLGRFWAARELRFDRVIVGPCRRHRESHEAIVRGYAGSEAWPDPEEDAGLNEYQAWEAMDCLAPGHREIAVDSDEGRRQYFYLYRKTMRRWARGEATQFGVESWKDFRARVEASVERMREALLQAGDHTMLVVTSGGPTAATAGYALGLDDLRTMEQSWTISNGSFSEFLVSRTAEEDRFSMVSFNATPHLDPESITGA
jgi:broad specificity phosphatase PhoE